ncbi:B-cell receptor CD22-like [Pelmatolapia mariae]|uniref:B-cell receptor CD22-like n=1 Tax=Pelmatolapia mariae TaxID=158779 RepID=UPI003211D900
MVEFGISGPNSSLSHDNLPNVEVTKIRVNESCTKAELKCKSSCTGDVSYVWLKNGEKVTEENPHITSLRFNDSICCALKRQEDYCSASLYPPKLPSVTVSPSGEIVEGSSVILICSSDANPAANYTWYKEGGQTPLSITKQLSLPSIRPSDSGAYNCTAENELGIRKSKHLHINVKYAPKFSSVSVSPSAEIVEGSSVTLTCSSDANPAANYTWYKEELFLAWPPEGAHHFTSISSVDRGNYCKSENQYGQINSSRVFINVQYAPKLPSVSVSPSAEIVDGSSVTLTCRSDANPAANYTWYKENEALPLGPEGCHHFISTSSVDRGNYFCKSKNQYGQINSSHVFINVQYAPKLPSVSVSPSGEMVEGSSVTLTCRSDANPAANYTWYKEKEDSPKAHGQNFTIGKFSPEHSGAYQSCNDIEDSTGHNRLVEHPEHCSTDVEGPQGLKK